MKLATILPTAHLEVIAGMPYHMALAHLVGVDEKYTKFYARESENGAYVIMDNGVIEDAQQNIVNIIDKAKLIDAKEIILPDVYMKSQETIESSYDALCYVNEHEPAMNVMAVPQGETMEEWLDCAEEMLTWDVHCLGIPKVLTKIAGRDGRLEALMALKQRCPWELKNVEIHLLGCWESPLELTMIAKAEKQKIINTIRGCDSAIAYVYTKAGLVISEDARPEGKVDFNNTQLDMMLLAKNLNIWEQSIVLERGVVCPIL